MVRKVRSLHICTIFSVVGIAVFASQGCRADARPENCGATTANLKQSDAQWASPNIVIWAWERPENIQFLDPHKTAVAFFAARLKLLQSGQVLVVPRTQMLKFARNSYLIAVVRIDNSNQSAARLNEEGKRKILQELLRAAQLERVKELQVDFDAREDERQFYRQLLADLRALMPRRKKLTMTALASWCLYDRWISNLPVDESVAMLFSMGKERKNVLAAVAARGLPADKQTAIGLSLQEPDVRATLASLGNKRIYLFNAKAWMPETFNQAIAMLNQHCRLDRNESLQLNKR